MSSRIIRADRVGTGKVSAVSGNVIGVTSQEHYMDVEKQAFEQGYAEGERIGKQMGEAMQETICKRYDKSLADLAAAHRDLVRLMEEETVRLAIEIARKIVQRELTMDPDLVVALTTATLKRVSGQQSIVVRVSRHDVERVRAAIANAKAAVTVKDDPALERGDCLIDTGQTHVDSRVGSQIDVISRTLFDE
jgi:flagellar assembly protein FliH